MQSLANGLINAEVLLPIGDSKAMATVISCAVDDDGRLIWEHNDNPMLNSLMYMCEFPGGTVKEYLANVIPSNLFSEANSAKPKSYPCSRCKGCFIFYEYLRIARAVRQVQIYLSGINFA